MTVYINENLMHRNRLEPRGAEGKQFGLKAVWLSDVRTILRRFCGCSAQKTVAGKVELNHTPTLIQHREHTVSNMKPTMKRIAWYTRKR